MKCNIRRPERKCVLPNSKKCAKGKLIMKVAEITQILTDDAN